MVQRALLVGCNYPGTNCPLRGCINDVATMTALLTTHFGFAPTDILTMVDTDKSNPALYPTGKNVKERLAELVAASKAGDVLFFHFSGHGTQVPAGTSDETDGKNEAICPTDLNVICDDDLRQILSPLDMGCKFTMIADCCHSGTLLDHQQVAITGSKDGTTSATAPEPQLNLGGIAAMFGLKDLDMSTNKNRALPMENLLEMLSGMLGKQVSKGGVHTAMRDLFGNSASAKSMNYLGMAADIANKLSKSGMGGKEVQKVAGVAAKLLGCCTGHGAAGGAGGPDALPGGEKPNAGTGGQPAPKLHADKGILVTGCMANETSADACPSGDPSKAYGALTNAVRTVLDAHFQQHPGSPISYRTLVTSVRTVLSQGKFAQNPCLECSEKNADSPFIR